MARDSRWPFERIEEIIIEEGDRAAAITDEASIDGWGPLVHIQANMDPTVTLVPLDYTWAAYAMNCYYRTFRNHGVIRLGEEVYYPYGREV